VVSLDRLDILGTPDQVATVDSLVLQGTQGTQDRVDSPDTQEAVFLDIQDNPDTAVSPG